MLEIKNLIKSYDENVLDHISIKFPECGLFVITGESGCGKSTLLHIIGGLDLDYQGEIIYNGKNIRNIKNYIKKHIGFVFQNIYLINEMKVKDNYLLSSFFKYIYTKRKDKYLKKLYLDKLFVSKTSLLSGGEKQRVAIMRSFIADNSIILCDEPTGSLDNDNSQKVFSILKDLSKERLVIVISHDMELSKKYSDYLYKLENGKLHLLKERKRKEIKTLDKKTHKPFLLFCLKYYKMSLKSNLLLTQVFFISIFCILLTFSLTQSSRKQIQNTIDQIIPSTSIMCKRKDNQDILLDELTLFDKDYIQYRCMEYEDIEMLGLSKKDTFHINDTLFVSDYTQNLKNEIVKGRKLQKDDEIVVSLTTYDHLCDLFGKNNVLDKKVNLYLQNRQSVLSTTVKIVGVTNHKTALDTIYLKEYAYSHICSQLFMIEKGQMCFLQVNDSKNLELLKKNYPQYNFQIANAQLNLSIDEKMKQLENILMCFCLLAVMSSYFLLGEVLYLSVVKRKRMFAIFKSMGATKQQISFLIFLQGIFISVMAYIQAVFMLHSMVNFINQFISNIVQDIANHFFMIDNRTLIYVFVFSLFLTVISCLIPVFKANKIDIIQNLKN